MSIPAARPQVLDCLGTPLVLSPSPGQFTSDAGLLPVRPFDQRIGLTRTFAALPGVLNARSSHGVGSRNQPQAAALASSRMV